MSVAENPTIESARANPQQQLAVGSALGAVAVLLGLWVILAGFPYLWGVGWERLFEGNEDLVKNEFLSDALLILVELVLVGSLALLAYRALQNYTQSGLRAGIFFGAVILFATLWIGAWLGQVVDTQYDDNPAVGISVLAVVMGGLIAGAAYVYLKVPGWQAFLEAVEHQGWFHAIPYKGNQGVRVRRGSIMGVLAVGVCGIIVMSTHKNFGVELPPSPDNPRGVPNDWSWLLPYTTEGTQVQYIPLMYKVHMMMPILLGLALLWVAWRVVNIPAFADFLIATEAEMNKVSWTTRKRLVQDTIVVLTTVFLFTTFLFIVDVVWIKILSAPGIKVLLIDPKEAEKEQQETAKW